MSTYEQKRARRAELAAAAARDERLLSGETLRAHHAHDCTGCGCPPTHEHAGVDCVELAAGGRGAGEYHRCLSCSVRWRPRWRRSDPVRFVVKVAGAML